MKEVSFFGPLSYFFCYFLFSSLRGPTGGGGFRDFSCRFYQAWGVFARYLGAVMYGVTVTHLIMGPPTLRRVPYVQNSLSHLFLRARKKKKKDFPFFSFGGDPVQTSLKTQPLQVAFSLLERLDLRSQKDGIWGKKIAWGRGGVDRAKKGKRMRKKRRGHFGTKK